jgi:hypothetical protein
MRIAASSFLDHGPSPIRGIVVHHDDLGIA